MSDLEIRGYQQLGRLAAACEAQAAGEFRAELAAAMRPGTERASTRMQDSITTSLPRSGGLAAAVKAGSTFDVTGGPSITGAKASVDVTSRYDIDRMNQLGNFVHPVYGDSPWVEQSAGVRRGFLDDAFRASVPEIEASTVEAVAVAREVLYRAT